MRSLESFEAPAQDVIAETNPLSRCLYGKFEEVCSRFGDANCRSLNQFTRHILGKMICAMVDVRERWMEALSVPVSLTEMPQDDIVQESPKDLLTVCVKWSF
jgi:hypothetical protein